MWKLRYFWFLHQENLILRLSKHTHVNDAGGRFQWLSGKNQRESHRFLPENPGKWSDLEAGTRCPYLAAGYASVLSENGKSQSPDSDTVFLLPCSDHFQNFPTETVPYASNWVYNRTNLIESDRLIINIFRDGQVKSFFDLNQVKSSQVRLDLTWLGVFFRWLDLTWNLKVFSDDLTWLDLEFGSHKISNQVKEMYMIFKFSPA